MVWNITSVLDQYRSGRVEGSVRIEKINRAGESVGYGYLLPAYPHIFKKMTVKFRGVIRECTTKVGVILPYLTNVVWADGNGTINIPMGVPVEVTIKRISKEKQVYYQL